MTQQMVSFLGTTLASGQAVPQVVSNANPFPVTLSGGIGGLAVAGTIADGQPALVQFPVTAGGVDGAGNVRRLLIDTATGALSVILGGGGAVTVQQATAANLNAQVVGNVANNVADAGNPVKVGGVYQTAGTLTTLTVGVRGDVQLDSFGNVRSAISGPIFTGSDGLANNVAKIYGANTNATATSGLSVYPAWFNGSTWDRQTKPRTAFRLTSSAASNNAANIKASAGTVYSITALVTAATAGAYLKLFDSAGAPNPAAVNPLYMFGLTFTGGNTGPFQVPLPAQGLYFPTGIGVAIVANPADLDNTAILAGQVTALNISFA